MASISYQKAFTVQTPVIKVYLKMYLSLILMVGLIFKYFLELLIKAYKCSV